MELPASWNLKARENGKGGLDIVGRDDSGSEYVARRTNEREITERDVRELKAADRESTTAKQFVNDLVDEQRKRDSDRGKRFDDDLFDAALPVARAGIGFAQVSFQNAPKWRIDLAFKGL